MALSVFDLFTVGIGPSSSHTVGPMRAAGTFGAALQRHDRIARTHRVVVQLYGSLAATARGHGTDTAVILGLLGESPERVDPPAVADEVRRVRAEHRLRLYGVRDIAFDPEVDLVLHPRDVLPAHPNGLTFTAYDGDGSLVDERTYYSVGGGFVVDGRSIGEAPLVQDVTGVPHPFRTAADLLDRCEATGLSIARLVLENELTWRSEDEVRAKLLHLWSVMRSCVEAGRRTEGILPGGLRVRRRAPDLARRLRREAAAADDPMRGVDWVTLWALAVNEENAAGGRVVTAPTNGAAGIIPAVLHYAVTFVPGVAEEDIVVFLLTAGAIGMIYKQTASISGAEVGCQGEVGTACSMAAAGLTALHGGTTGQIENAAEIGMEHNLGLTCDPVGGLVQIPCIERNAIAAVMAIAASRTALMGDGSHKVTLDEVITTMRETGADMKDKYKETARGGLAVNVIEC